MELPDDLPLTLQRESLEKNPARELIVRKINAHIQNETLNQARFRKHLIDLHRELYGMFGITMPILNLVAIIDATSLFSLSMPSQFLAPASNENGTPARFVHNGKRYSVVGSSKNGIELSQLNCLTNDSLFIWDYLVWMDYDENFELKGCWLWSHGEFRAEFSDQYFANYHKLREGKKLFPFE